MLHSYKEEEPTEVLNSGWILEVPKVRKKNKTERSIQPLLPTSNSSENPGWRQGHAIPTSRLLLAEQFSSTPARALVAVVSSVVYYGGFRTSWATGARLKSTPAPELMSYLATAYICLIKVIIPCSVAIKA